MTYKGELCSAMTALAADPLVRFIGYGIRIGKAGGTLKDVAESQLIETPVAENLMVGMAIGLALKGLKPVVFIERFDFILNALDAIVNHLDKLNDISRGEFNPCIILRVVVGNKEKPLFTGPTHCQDFSEAMRHLVNFPIFRLTEPDPIQGHYAAALRSLSKPYEAHRNSTMLVEYKDLM